jgi:hypothetical protein
MIKNHVDISLVATSISSMIMYKAVIKLYMKAAYSQGSFSKLFYPVIVLGPVK